MIKSAMSLYFRNILWRINNKHNRTSLLNVFNTANVCVGNMTYGGLFVISYNDINKLIIGNFCSIAPNVIFVLSGDHNIKKFSTFPFRYYYTGINLDNISKGDIIIDDDVWIGCNSIILSGVHIGQGAVIGAGSVVTKDVPPYAFVVGNPAKVIKYRFNDDIIKKLLKINYNLVDKNIIKNNIELLYQDVTDSNCDIIINYLNNAIKY